MTVTTGAPGGCAPRRRASTSAAERIGKVADVNAEIARRVPKMRNESAPRPRTYPCSVSSICRTKHTGAAAHAACWHPPAPRSAAAPPCAPCAAAAEPAWHSGVPAARAKQQPQSSGAGGRERRAALAAHACTRKSAATGGAPVHDRGACACAVCRVLACPGSNGKIPGLSSRYVSVALARVCVSRWSAAMPAGHGHMLTGAAPRVRVPSVDRPPRTHRHPACR